MTVKTVPPPTPSEVAVAAAGELDSLVGLFALRAIHTASRDARASAAGTYLRLFQTIFENSFIWRPKRLVTLLNL